MKSKIHLHLFKLSAERLKRKYSKPIMFNKKIFEQSLNMITRQVDDIHHLVDEFSSFARMPAPILNQVNVFVIVREYVEPLNISFDKITIKLDNTKYKNIFIMADEKQIRQAIGNIIKNSYENIITNNIKNGNISIDFENDNDFVSILLKDNGTGINPNDISRMVEPYFSTKTNGSGLGLAITKKIIEDHNGSITIKSPKDEQGTIIIITILIGLIIIVILFIMLKNKISILIVDDEIDICDTVSAILSINGITTSVKNFVNIIKKNDITLIITDIWMNNNVNAGLDLLTWCQNYNILIPVIMMSGHGSIEIAVAAIKQGAYDFIEKPFKTDKLLFSKNIILTNVI